MPEESKIEDPKSQQEAIEEVKNELAEGDANADGEDEEADEDDAPPDASNPDAVAASSATKKKKSKKRKLKNALTGKKEGEASASGLTGEQLQQVLEHNPSLKAEVSGMDEKKMQEMLKTLSVQDILSGMGIGGKNHKDMASYKFWSTQPVTRFDDASKQEEEGPIKQIDIDRVSAEPSPLVEGFEWVTMDLTDAKQLEEVYDLLTYHYVEDEEAMFRFNYSSSFLHWALMAPGWRKEWHVGVRASQSKKLVAFISGIPIQLRVRNNILKCSEINYLCIHKKLRSKRLAPVLIKEITRRCYRVGIFQAIYTAGVVLPTPIATCRYFHRSLNWEKLYDVGFSPMPPGSTRLRQVSKYKLPDRTSTAGLRPMQRKDCDKVLSLMKRYMDRTTMAQTYTQEEFEHWLIHDTKAVPDQVVWSYVVEEPTTHKITDFFSFYSLCSTVIRSSKHKTVNAAYLFYYASESAFDNDKGAYKARLNALIKDALILARDAGFDVFNALTLLDNPLFLEDQKFGAGDGMLHYYLYNYRAPSIPGGIDAKNLPDEKYMGGVGIVML